MSEAETRAMQQEAAAAAGGSGMKPKSLSEQIEEYEEQCAITKEVLQEIAQAKVDATAEERRRCVAIADAELWAAEPEENLRYSEGRRDAASSIRFRILHP